MQHCAALECRRLHTPGCLCQPVLRHCRFYALVYTLYVHYVHVDISAQQSMYHVTDGSKYEVGCFLSSTLTLLLLFSLAGSLLYTFAAAAAERKPARAVDWFWAERTPSDDSLLQMREHSGRRRSAWVSYFKLAAANSPVAMQSGEMIKKKHKHHLLLMQSDGEM